MDTPFLYGKLLSLLRTIWLCESSFSTVNFTKSKYRLSISAENLTFKWRCALSVKSH